MFEALDAREIALETRCQRRELFHRLRAARRRLSQLLHDPLFDKNMKLQHVCKPLDIAANNMLNAIS